MLLYSVYRVLLTSTFITPRAPRPPPPPRLRNSSECIALLHTLRGVGAKIDLNLILRVARAIPYTQRSLKQMPVMGFVSARSADPGEHDENRP